VLQQVQTVGFVFEQDCFQRWRHALIVYKNYCVCRGGGFFPFKSLHRNKSIG
jgi:hypothetical protein